MISQKNTIFLEVWIIPDHCVKWSEIIVALWKKLKGRYAFVTCVHKWQLLHCKQWILIYAKTVSKSNCDRPFWDKNNLVTSAAFSLWLKYKIILQKYFLWMFLFFDHSVLKNNPLYLNPFSRIEKQVKWAQGVGFPTVWIFW